MSQGLQALTEKEKEILRLIGRGHDAKSSARHLGVSVHTINERLRFARRKMAVTSSREAARILMKGEEELQISTAKFLGEAARQSATHDSRPSSDGRGGRPASVITGALALFSVLAAIAYLGSSAQGPRTPPVANAATVPDRAVIDAAISWLTLVDAGEWEASHRATGRAFQRLNSQARWAAASEKVRTPLGTVRSRHVLDQQHLIAPPHGYESLRFRTDFVIKPNATETVTLEREGTAYRVVSYVIE